MAITIGPEGGTLSLETGTEGVTLELTIPSGALTKPTQIKVTEMPGPTPAGFTDYSPLYLFEPIDTLFSTPAGLRVPWSIQLQQGVAFEVKRELSIYTSPSPADGFQRLSDSYVNAGFSQASIVKLGYLFVGYPASLDPPVCTAGP